MSVMLFMSVWCARSILPCYTIMCPIVSGNFSRVIPEKKPHANTLLNIYRNIFHLLQESL